MVLVNYRRLRSIDENVRFLVLKRCGWFWFALVENQYFFPATFRYGLSCPLKCGLFNHVEFIISSSCGVCEKVGCQLDCYVLRYIEDLANTLAVLMYNGTSGDTSMALLTAIENLLLTMLEWVSRNRRRFPSDLELMAACQNGGILIH